MPKTVHIVGHTRFKKPPLKLVVWLEHSYGKKPIAIGLRKGTRKDYDERSYKAWSPICIEDTSSDGNISVGNPIDMQLTFNFDVCGRAHSPLNSYFEQIPPTFQPIQNSSSSNTINTDEKIAQIYTESNERIAKMYMDCKRECEQIRAHSNERITRMKLIHEEKIARIHGENQTKIANIMVVDSNNPHAIV